MTESPSSQTHKQTNKTPTIPHDDIPPLPDPNTQRWDTRRKAQIVEAVKSGRLSLDHACATYAMSVDEFLSWQSLFDRHGVKGLMATRVKQYRRAYNHTR